MLLVTQAEREIPSHNAIFLSDFRKRHKQFASEFIIIKWTTLTTDSLRLKFRRNKSANVNTVTQPISRLPQKIQKIWDRKMRACYIVTARCYCHYLCRRHRFCRCRCSFRVKLFSFNFCLGDDLLLDLAHGCGTERDGVSEVNLQVFASSSAKNI